MTPVSLLMAIVGGCQEQISLMTFMMVNLLLVNQIFYILQIIGDLFQMFMFNYVVDLLIL